MNNDRFRFRFWDIFNAVMINSHDEHNGINSCFFAEFEKSQDGDNNPVLMQCTGLKDKNGVLIFEGDILKWTYEITNGDFFGVIEYHIKKIPNLDIDTNHIGFIVNGIDTRHGNYFTEFPLGSLYEVIGNIHENPELIEQ